MVTKQVPKRDKSNSDSPKGGSGRDARKSVLSASLSASKKSMAGKVGKTSKTGKTAMVARATATIPAPKINVVDIEPMENLLGPDKQEEFELGQLVSGHVAAIARNKIVVDLDAQASGVILGQEIMDSSKAAEGLKVGDGVDAMLIGPEDEEGNYRLSLRKASQQKTWQSFLDAHENDTAIDVNIIEANKGGLLIDVDGIRGFIPVSQLSPANYPRVNGADAAKILTKLQDLIGRKLTVKILNINKTEGRLILSERAAQQEDRMKVIKKLKVGQTIKGRVSGIVNFGIFVNYGGIEGLVHISEITWGHVDDPGKYARVSEELEVMVIGIDGEKVSFSMKRLTPDPWLEAVTKYKVGSVIKGPVRRVTPFGAFVKLGEDIDGLIHISELSSRHVEDPNELVSVGDEVEAKVINIDSEERRLGLSIKALTEPEEKEDGGDKDKKVEDDDKGEDKGEDKDNKGEGGREAKETAKSKGNNGDKEVTKKKSVAEKKPAAKKRSIAKKSFAKTKATKKE